MKFLVAISTCLMLSDAFAGWSQEVRKDPMGREDKYISTSKSTNTRNLGSPYGAVRGTLSIRRQGDSIDILFYVDRGQFLCNSNDCSVTVRFDDKPAVEINAVGPADYSSDVLFISYAERFAKEAIGSKKILIEATFFQSGRHIFYFDSRGFENTKVGNYVSSKEEVRLRNEELQEKSRLAIEENEKKSFDERKCDELLSSAKSYPNSIYAQRIFDYFKEKQRCN